MNHKQKNDHLLVLRNNLLNLYVKQLLWTKNLH